MTLELARQERPHQGLDRVTIGTRDARAARRLYEHALRPLGFTVAFAWPDGGRVYLGLAGEPSSLWLVEDADPGRTTISVAAPRPAQVDAFHAAAVAAGASSVSAPAPRPEHNERTYAASVRDADGNMIEAICWHADPVLTATERAA